MFLYCISDIQIIFHFPSFSNKPARYCQMTRSIPVGGCNRFPNLFRIFPADSFCLSIGIFRSIDIAEFTVMIFFFKRALITVRYRQRTFLSIACYNIHTCTIRSFQPIIIRTFKELNRENDFAMMGQIICSFIIDQGVW